MAVERTGTAISISTVSATGSQSIAVPSDCTCAVLFHLGAQDNADTVFGSGGATFTLGGSSFVWQGRTPSGSNNCDGAVLTLVNPASGSQTFAWNGCTEDYGVGLFVVFYKGVDTSNPVLDADGNSNITGTVTVSGLTTDTGSMTVLGACVFTNTPNTAINSQTVIVNNYGPVETTYLYVDIAEKAEASSVSSEQPGIDYCGVVAISLRASAVTASLNQHSFRFFNDDGSESAATVKAAINTNINLSANDVARVRFLVDSTGDAPATNFTLEYRKKPSGGSFGPWLEVE